MTSLTRWKLAAALLAAIAGYGLFFHGGGSAPSNTPATQVASRDGSLPMQFRRPLRVSAEAAGVSKADLVERILAARNLKDVQTLAEKLGIVGDDESIEATKGMLADTRSGVPEAMLGAYGHIGSEHAIGILIDKTKDDRPNVRQAAIDGLGGTQSEAGEKLLLEIAQKPGDPLQTRAILALGAMASDRSIEALVKLVDVGDYSVSISAVRALGKIESPAADTALKKLVDAPDSRIAVAALGEITTIDKPFLAKLTGIVKSGDQQLAAAAMGTLGSAGEEALPVLREAAFRGGQGSRWQAVMAISQIGGPKAIDLLGEILKTGDRQSAIAASSSLASIGGAEARAILTEVALSERGEMSGALNMLTKMEGPDIEAALVAVLRDREGSHTERRTVLPRLIKSGNAEALQLAIDFANKGTRTERQEAMRMLADSGVPRAFDALVDVAGKSRGQTRVTALEMLAQVKPADASVAQLLSDSLFSHRRDEASYAATVLGRIGTDQARSALVNALGDKDQELAAVAAGALGEQGLTDSTKTALMSAAQSNPLIKAQVMQQLIHANAPEGIRMAEDLLNGKDSKAASQVVYALSNLGTADAKRLIDRALASESAEVRLAAVGAMGNDGDERTSQSLLRLAHDSDAGVRSAALRALGNIGSDAAQRAIIDATASGKAEERIAAINGLASIDDPRASAQLARLMRDSDPAVASAAISNAYNGGPEVDQTLVYIVNDPNTTPETRSAAAHQLRGRGSDLDDATEKKVTEIAGQRQLYGGYGYGGGCCYGE